MRMSKIWVIIFILFTFATDAFAYTESLKADWKEYKSDHFIVHYHPSISSKYIREFTKRCERYYHLIAERLGFRRFDYWSWEKRARIFIYSSRPAYVKDRGRSEWSVASVHVAKKFIRTYYFAEDFFDAILPHELTHIILREYIGLNRRLPLWFEEGVACANEDGCYLKYLLVLKSSLHKGDYTPVAKLQSMKRQDPEFNEYFYPMAASLVIFLLEEYGRDDFLRLLRNLRDGSSFYKALDEAYRMKSPQELDERFLTFLGSKSYEEIARQRTINVRW